jgi:hypothetical protein
MITLCTNKNTPVYDIGFKCLEKFDEIREYHETHDTGLTMRVFEMENRSPIYPESLEVYYPVTTTRLR